MLIDLSAVVTAWLLALALPPLLPWWQTVIGSAFAIIVAKQLFGGIGFNPFNPAMAGYVLLLVSFPVTMTRWLPPEVVSGNVFSLGQTLGIVFSGALPADLSWDAISSATPLDQMRSELSENRMISEIRQSPLWGDFGGLGWEWVGNWFLLGGLFLFWRRIITWRIPVSMLGSLLLVSGLFWAIDPGTNPSPGVSPVQRRGDTRRLFHRDRSGLGQHDAARPNDIRRVDWLLGLRDSHLGRLSRCGRICRTADEHGCADDRLLHPTEGVRSATGR